jgi:hypothetical protein
VGPLRRALVRVIRFCIERPAAFFGAAAVVLAAIAAVLLVPVLAPNLTLPGVALARGSSAPAATEDYLRGNQVYDARLMWNSLSSDAQQQLTGQGGSLDDLQREMQAAKDRGTKLEEISYIGGKSLPDGTSVEFYLVGVRDQPQASIDYEPYMFTLDRSGKISKVQ